MEAPTHNVFVYGTLKRGGWLHGYLLQSKYLGDGCLRNHDMYSLGPFPAVQPGLGQVQGELYEVDAVTLRKLDACEGEGSLYHRRKCWVELSEDLSIEAFVYIYAHGLNSKPKVDSGVWDVAT